MSNPTELQESYRILEIKPGATLEEIERAHENLAKSWDPRRFGNDESRRRKAEKKLKQLNQALETLTVELKTGDAPITSEPAAASAVSSPPAGSSRHWTVGWRFVWIVSMALAMAFLLYDSYVRLEGIKRTTDVSMTNFPLPEHDPNSPTGYPNNQHVLVLPALGTDGQHWLMQTERMVSGQEGIRVRHVDYDGVGPDGLSSGREVHWSSSLHWLDAAFAWVDHLITHEPIAYSLERTSQWANTAVLGLVMILLPIAILRRFGSIAAALLAFSFIAVYPYYEFSFVGYFDHHGLAATSALMMVLFVAGAGVGWLRNETLNPTNLTPTEKALWQWLPERRQAKRWLIASGIAAGAGLWISTATLIPAMFGVGVTALISTGWMVPERTQKGISKISPWIIGIGGFLGTLGGCLAYYKLSWPAWIIIVCGMIGVICGLVLAKGLLSNEETAKAPLLGRTDPTLWRVWGCAAGLTSLFFYLLEYAPAHFTMRLEVNHPLYALALFGAGDLMCRLSWFISGQPQPQKSFWPRQWPWMVLDLGIFAVTWLVIYLYQEAVVNQMVHCVLFIIWLMGVAAFWAVRYFALVKFDQPRDPDEAYWRKQWLRSLLSLAVVSLLPAAVLLFGEKVFVIRMGGFLLNLHMDYILEFHSVMLQLSTLSPMQIVGGISLIPLAVFPLILLLFTPDLQRPWKTLVLAILLPALVMLGLSISQIRWLGISCAILCAGLAVAALVTTSQGSTYRWRDGFRRPLAVLLLIVVLVPYPLFTALGWINNRDTIGDLDLSQIVTRDASEHLRERLGNETGVILSGPTTTTWMMYFGGFHGIGSLYWENVKGLETAAQIYSAPTDQDAKRLIDQYHITHIALFSWDPFAEQYARLGQGLRLPKTPQEGQDQFKTMQSLFIIKLWDLKQMPPPWLRYVPYQVPNSPLLKGYDVMLLEVVDPPMSPIESYLRLAQYLMTKNTPDTQAYAGKILNAILAPNAKPDYYPALITRAFLDQARGDLAAYQTDAQVVLNNVKMADDPAFPFEDRVGLAILLYNINAKPQAFAQVETCFKTATEKDLRHLTPERLQALLLLQAHLPPDIKVSAKTLDLAFSLLSKPPQGVVLGERAGAVYASDPKQAVTLYRQALKLNPDFEPAMTSLAKLLVLTPDAAWTNPTEAQNLLNNAVHAWRWPATELAMEAIDLLNKAAETSHLQSPENIQLLAYANAEAGKFDDAVFYGNMALMLLEDRSIPSPTDEQLNTMLQNNASSFRKPDGTLLTLSEARPTLMVAWEADQRRQIAAVADEWTAKIKLFANHQVAHFSSP